MLHWETQFVHHSIKWKSIFARKMKNNFLEENRNIIKFTQRRRKKLTRKIFLKVQGWSTISGEIKGNADRLNLPANRSKKREERKGAKKEKWLHNISTFVRGNNLVRSGGGSFQFKSGTKLPVFQKDYIKIQWKWILHDCSPNQKRSRLARIWTNLNKNLEKINVNLDGINPNKSCYQSEKILKHISTNLKRYLNKS